MDWFNYYGLVFVAVIMIPNIVYAIKLSDNATNNYNNKAAEVMEQVSRYGCIALMIFNIPHTWYGFYFPYAEIIYLTVNGVLVIAYCLAWLILWKKTGIVKALLLSILPTCVFLFSGVMLASIPLAVFAIIFAATHILISVKNAAPTEISARAQ